MGTMKNTKAAKAAPKTVKNLADLTAPVKPENPSSPIPSPDTNPEGAEPEAAAEPPAARQMTEEEFIDFMSKVTGRPDLVKAIMNAAKNPESVSEQKQPAVPQVSQADLKTAFDLLTATKAEKVNAEVVEDDDEDEDDEEEFDEDFIWNPDPAWETAGWVLACAALVGLGILIGHWATK